MLVDAREMLRIAREMQNRILHAKLHHQKIYRVWKTSVGFKKSISEPIVGRLDFGKNFILQFLKKMQFRFLKNLHHILVDQMRFPKALLMILE